MFYEGVAYGYTAVVEASYQVVFRVGNVFFNYHGCYECFFEM